MVPAWLCARRKIPVFVFSVCFIMLRCSVCFSLFYFVALFCLFPFVLFCCAVLSVSVCSILLRCSVCSLCHFLSVSLYFLQSSFLPLPVYHLAGLVVKATASTTATPGGLRRDFSGSSHTSDLNIGTPVATLPGAWQYRLQSQCWDWLDQCQYTVTGWGGKLDLQLLSQWGSTYDCLSRSVPERVVGTLSKQPTNKHLFF